MLRFLETAFRRWWVFCLPLAAMAALAVVSLQGQERKFESTAVVRADDDTLLASQDDDGGFSFETPADIASRQIAESLRTDEFIQSVRDRAEIEPGVVPGLTTLDDFRGAISTWSDGDHLVKVRAMTADPEASRRLAESTINGFRQAVVASTRAESDTAIKFWTDQAGPYREDVEQAQAAYDAFLEEHPDPIGDAQRPAIESRQLETLTDGLNKAEDKYGEIQTKIDEAELLSAQSEASVDQRLRMIDKPVVATAPLSTKKEQVVTVGLYLVLGALLSLGIIALLTMLDRSIHGAFDVKSRLGDGVDVLAEVPETKGKNRPLGADATAATTGELQRKGASV
jgi:capsular polysaccharide biosynthesis protein